MVKTGLKAQLEQLRRELGDAKTLGADARDDLHDMAKEIDRALDAAEPDVHTLRGRIEASALRFETSHPRLATLLGDMTDTLAKLGI